jgi:Acyl-CoA dehydrogenase, C-terminal domain
MISKVVASELVWQVIDRSVQLLGARGFLDTNVLGQFHRDYRILRIFEGATEAVSVYLGTLILRDPQAFLADLDTQFPASTVLPTLGDAFEVLSARLQALGARMRDPADSQRHVLANLAGEYALWGTLAMLCADRAARTGKDLDRYAARWTLHRLTGHLARGHDLSFRDLPPLAFLAESIDAYAHAVGDFDQTAAGEAVELDLLLTRSGPGLGE